MLDFSAFLRDYIKRSLPVVKQLLWCCCLDVLAFWQDSPTTLSAVLAVHHILLPPSLVPERDSYSGVQDRHNEPTVPLMQSCSLGSLWDPRWRFWSMGNFTLAAPLSCWRSKWQCVQAGQCWSVFFRHCEGRVSGGRGQSQGCSRWLGGDQGLLTDILTKMLQSVQAERSRSTPLWSVFFSFNNRLLEWRRTDGPAWCALCLGRSRVNFVLLKPSTRIMRK